MLYPVDVAALEIAVDVFTFPSLVPNCRKARERVGDMARAAGFEPEAVDDIMLAVGEAVVNAVKYGGNGQSDACFTVSCLSTQDRFCVSISDKGPGFSLEDLPSFEDALYADHGRGIHCMRALMDEVTFDFASGTTVRMVKLTPQT